MNSTKKDEVRFSMKPNPFCYALEFTQRTLVVGTAVALFLGIPFILPEIQFERAVGFLLISYAIIGVIAFLFAFVVACCLMIVVTDSRAIVRVSLWGKTMEGLSMAIETVKLIEITAFDETYGSVYLSDDKSALRNSFQKSEPDRRRRQSIRRAGDEVAIASIPIIRITSIRAAMYHPWPRLVGFYGFKGFDQFANIISENNNCIPNVQGVHNVD